MNTRNLLLALMCCLPLLMTAQTANWSAVLPAAFPTNMSGQIHGISRCSQIKFHPSNPNKMYAVSARGGLFISTNGGNNWSVTPGTDFMASMRLASVCVDFTNDSILYLGTGDHNYYYSGNGVYKSLNGGQTYTYNGLSGLLVCEMVMDPLDHNVVVAVTNSGIYKTTNGGTNWSLKTTARPFDDLKLKATNSRTLYASTNDSAFFRSTDFGNTWTQITSGIVLPSGITNGNGCRIAVTPADTNVVYLGMVANGGMLYKSTNGGTSFIAMKTAASPYLTYYSNASTSSGQGDYNFSIGVDRTNASIIYLVAHNIWKSTDNGSNWTQMTNWWEKCHTDMHQIITSPYNNNNLYDANDGGLFLSTDGGTTWNPKSDGIFGYEIYHGACSPTRRDMFSIGTQDNGELYATSTGWYTNRGGDWQSHCVFDYRPNSSMAYYFYPDWGGTPVPKRRLVTGSEATYGLPATITDFTDIAFNRSNVNLAFVADSVILRTTNLTTTTPTWTQIASLSKKIMAIHSSIADANKLFVITSDGMIYVSTNALAATPTFTSYTLPNSTNNAATITTIKSNSNVVYITANTQVYRSADNGATWTNIKYNLPSVNHVRILSDEYFSNNELVFLASSNAVYYKTANAQSWSIYSDFLPSRTSIVEMSIYNDSTANTVLRVATYGRGMWETPINNLRSLAANFAADNTNPCTGQTVTFSDLSTGTSTSRVWSFPGGTPSSSTALNPTVVYNTSGSFNVTLKVYNGTIDSSTISCTAYISTTGGALPLVEGFEGTDDPPIGWKNVDYLSNGYLWQKTTSVGGYANSSSSMYFDNYNWNVPGQKDQLIAKRLSFASYNSATLTFDVAYMPYTGYSDTLRVLVSTDCGATYTPVYAKGGTVLATVASGTSYFTPTASQWRTETVNLNSYVGNNSVLVAFENINGYGNALYIDNVNINATVAANAGNDVSFCSGGSASIGMSPVSGINYSWSPTIGLSNANISNPVASPTSTTTYVLTATHAISGILQKDTVVVTVNPLPTINAGPDVSVCAGNSVTLNASSNSSFSWSNGVTNNVSFIPTATTNYFATANNNGCIKTDTVLVTVSPLPAINAGVDVSVCAGNSVTLNATSSSSFSWNNGVTNNVSFIPIATTNYIATANNNGCIKTDTVLVTVIPLPTINAGADVSVCAGNSIALNAASNSSISWNNGITNNVSFIPTTTTNYIATATNNGCIKTDTVLVTVSPSPTINAGADVSVCIGNSVTLIATSNTSVVWNNGISNNQTFIPTTTSNYIATATNNSGCSKADTVLVTVNPLPTINAGSDVAICNGGSVILNAISNGTVSWNNGVINNQAFMPTTSSTYIATATSSFGCVNQDTMLVSMFALSIANGGSDKAICPGGNTTLTASGGGTYVWSNGDTTASTNISQAGSYYVVVTNNNGCKDTSANVNVTVLAMPAAIKIKSIGLTTVCEPNTIPFVIDLPLGSTTGFIYQWNLNGSPIAGATDSTWNAVNTGSYTLTVSGGNICTKSSTAKPVTIKPLPNASFSVNGATTICSGGSVTLTAPTISGYTYTWLKDGTSAGGGNTKVVKLSGIYTVIAKLGTCVDTANNNVNVVVNQLPVASVSALTPITFCIGDSCLIAATPAANGFSYEWHNGTPAISTTSLPYYSALTTGTFKVMITDTNGCVSKLSATSVKTKQNPLPVASISVTGSTTIPLAGSTKLNASPSSGVTWQWYLNGNTIAGATTKQLIVTSGGNYTVAVNKLGCIGFSSPTTIIQTQAKDIQGTSLGDNKFSFTAFPNPVNETLTIEVHCIDDVNAVVYMLDVFGQTVGNWQWKAGKAGLKIDVSTYPSGIYILRYKDSQGRSATTKVVKE